MQLTKMAEDRLIAAIQDIVHLVDEEGTDPTAAIIKVANDGTWSPHYVRRICEAYNIGRQEAQRKSAQTTLAKFATFALADADAALATLFPSGQRGPEKVAADYQSPPTWLPDLTPKTPSLLTPLLEKAAAAIPAPTPSIQTHLTAVTRTAKQAELALQDLRECQEGVKQALSKLGRYFRLSDLDRMPFAFAEKVAEAYYPADAKLILNYVHAHHCPQEKRAEANQFPPGKVDRAQRPFNLLTEAVEWSTKLAASGARFQAAKEASTQAFAAYCAARETLCRPFDQAPTSPHLSIFQEPKTAGFASIAGAAGFGAGVKSLADDTIKSMRASRPSADQLLDKEQLALEDPGHDEELRKIRVQAMLTDLMANDEVISKHSPDLVLQKFNHLQGMMPSLSSQPATMGPYLRRALQGHLEPFEAAEMAKLQATVHSPHPPTRPSTLELKHASCILG